MASSNAPARARRAFSMRTHFLLIVLVGAVLPMTLIGVWLTRSAVRSGETLLGQQLDASVANVTEGIRSRWQFRRGDLLLLANNDAAVRLLTLGSSTAADTLFLTQLFLDVQRAISWFELLDATGQVRWSNAVAGRASDTLAETSRNTRTSNGPAVTVSLAARSQTGEVIGKLNARVLLASLVPSDSGRSVVPGSVIGVRDRDFGQVLLRVGEDSFPHTGMISIGNAQWLVRGASLDEPALDIVVAAPTAAYVASFERAGRLGLTALALVTLVVLALCTFLTTRVTRSLQSLVDAADAVSRGDLGYHAQTAGPHEVGALANAFNTMSDSLRRTLDELTRRNALAAVGEFAASLAHEVRNALTSVRVDLQRAEEKLPASPSRVLVARSLGSVTRLNSAVSGALRVARSGSVIARPVDLRPVLASAARGAAVAFDQCAASLDDSGVSAEPLWVNGDPDALEQLFLNLLLNAGQALTPGGHARISTSNQNGHVEVAIADTGAGMNAEQMRRSTEPFYTTRPNGTGLGLPIARQIAEAHGGDIVIESEPGRGTVIRVLLPHPAQERNAFVR